MVVSEVAKQAWELYRVARLHRLPPEAVVARYGAKTRARFAEAALAPNAVPVVIPAHNEERDLPATLKAIADMGVLALAIVVSNNSTDSTVAYAQAMGAQVMEVNGEGLRKMAATQAAIGTLAVQRLLFTDADTLPSSGWAAEMLAKLDSADNGKGAIVFGNSIPLFSGSVMTDAAMTLWRGLSHIKAHIRGEKGRSVRANGHNMAIAFDDAGHVAQAIMNLPPDTFAQPGRTPDDIAMLEAVRGAGGEAATATNIGAVVVTGGDRVTHVSQVFDLAVRHRSYADVVAPSYAAQYYGGLESVEPSAG